MEKAGGSVTTVYYNKLGLRALLQPDWFEAKGRLLPRAARYFSEEEIINTREMSIWDDLVANEGWWIIARHVTKSGWMEMDACRRPVM